MHLSLESIKIQVPLRGSQGPDYITRSRREETNTPLLLFPNQRECEVLRNKESPNNVNVSWNVRETKNICISRPHTLIQRVHDTRQPFTRTHAHYRRYPYISTPLILRDNSQLYTKSLNIVGLSIISKFDRAQASSHLLVTHAYNNYNQVAIRIFTLSLYYVVALNHHHCDLFERVYLYWTIYPSQSDNTLIQIFQTNWVLDKLHTVGI